MYKVKPYNDTIEIVDKPTTMYTMKSYHGGDEQKPTSNSQNVGDDLLVELNKQQQSQLNRLNRLKEKLNQFCDDLNLTHLIVAQPSSSHGEPPQTAAPTQQRVDFASNSLVQQLVKSLSRVCTKKFPNRTSVEDFVVQVDPQHVPYSLLALLAELTTSYKCFVQFFVHGTVLKQFAERSGSSVEATVRGLADLVNCLKLSQNESRNSYDYALTIVWKKSKTEKLGAQFSLNGTKIFGEANVLRHLNRLLPAGAQNHENLKLTESIFVDEWIDKCTNELRLASKPNADSYAANLNKHLTSAKFLANDKPSIADYYTWSVLKQAGVKVDSTSKLNNINQWVKRLEAANPLVQLLNML